MKQEWKDVSEQAVLEKIKGLEAQEIAEVINFIEFLAEKKQREAPLMTFLNEAGAPKLRLEEVRARLAKISGQISDIVSEERYERG